MMIHLANVSGMNPALIINCALCVRLIFINMLVQGAHREAVIRTMIIGGKHTGPTTANLATRIWLVLRSVTHGGDINELELDARLGWTNSAAGRGIRG
jgi:hypothetical protein